MNNTRTAWLDNITSEEKKTLEAYTKKQLIISALICIPICTVAIMGVLRLNNGVVILNMGETEKSVYNVLFVFAGIICLRLFIAQIISFLKEKKVWQKKVMLREVAEIKNKTVLFKEDETRYKIINDQHLNIGDKVEVSVAEKLPVILSIKRIQA